MFNTHNNFKNRNKREKTDIDEEEERKKLTTIEDIINRGFKLDKKDIETLFEKGSNPKIQEHVFCDTFFSKKYITDVSGNIEKL